jgi:predicted permease
MNLLRRLIALTRRRREDAELNEELEYHRSLIQNQLESNGIPASEAAAASRRAMGNLTLAREDAREVWVLRWMDHLARDVKYAVRTLRREPTIALTATLTLALGVTTTATVFSVADAELWKPLPFRHPEQLVSVYSRGPGARAQVDGISGAELLEWRTAASVFSDLATNGQYGRRVLHLETAESVVVSEVTANYFATLGRQAREGRTFSDGDRRGQRSAIVTDRAWHRLFGADPAIVGRSIKLDSAALVIIGIVAADDFAPLLGGVPDIFVPIDEGSPGFLDRTAHRFYGAIGRLQPGASAETARSQLQAGVQRFSEQYGHQPGQRTFFVEDLREDFTGYNWRPLYFFMGASLVVLLLTAVNVATLLLSRAMRRAREFALRGALGGGRGTLARQLVVEGAVMALPGGALGVLLTVWAVRLFMSVLPADFLVRGNEIHVDIRVLIFTLAATAISAAIFALVPLPLATRVSATNALRTGGRTGETAGEGRFRSLLLTAQITLTVVLLAGAAIFLKSYAALVRVPLGFDPGRVAALRVSLSGPRYENDESLRRYADRLVDEARTVSGTREVTVASTSPLGSGPIAYLARSDRPRPAGGEETRAIIRAVGPDYFRTLRIPLVHGREFSADDAAGAARVAIVNATLAARLFPGENPVGQSIELLPSTRAPWTRRPGILQIVGVAANVKEVGINEVDFGGVYAPYAQLPSPSLELIVRTGVPTAAVADALRSHAARVDPAVPVTSVTWFEQRVAGALQGDRFNVLLVSTFAAVAILLAAIGIYGTAAYHVQARTRELAVRLALGARPAALASAALFRVGRLAGGGALLGLAATLAIARLLGNALYLVPGEHNGLLYGVTTTDPAMLTFAVAGILIIAVVAAALPARQVSRVDPAQALRAE